MVTPKWSEGRRCKLGVAIVEILCLVCNVESQNKILLVVVFPVERNGGEIRETVIGFNGWVLVMRRSALGH